MGDSDKSDRRGRRVEKVMVNGLDCATAKVCTGKRGGIYCLTDTGAKRYLKAE